MTASAAQIAQVRRMVAEPGTTTYSDTLIQGFIEDCPVMDELGTDPYTWSTNGSGVPVKTTVSTWVATYDLNAAAAAIWEEKAAACAANYDFSADGGDYTRSQAYLQAMAMAKHYRSRARIREAELFARPKLTPSTSSGDMSWIGNLAEED